MEVKERFCYGCNTLKPIKEFGKDKHQKDGYTFRCKVCRNKYSYKWNNDNPEKVKEANLKNREKRKQFYSSEEGKKSSRKSWLKKTYNISLEEYELKLQQQNSCCAICNEPDSKDRWKCLAVDHDHKTGVIRDLLCYKCNAGLGLFNDNKELLIKTIKYLEKHAYNSINTNGFLQNNTL